jgi:predicted permease
MVEIAAVVAPVFGLIGLGYLAARFGLISDRGGDGLAEYVFALAIPVLLFRTIATADLPDALPWGYWASYFIGVAVVWSLATLLARTLFRRSSAEGVIFGFAAGQANTVMVGVPLILKAAGTGAAAPLVLLLAVHLPVTMTAATLLFEGTGPGGRRAALARVVRAILTHPILIGIALGLVSREAGLAPAGPAATIVDGVAASASPCALIAMGLALHRYGVRGEWQAALAISALKLLLHPALVFLLARYVFGLPFLWALVGLLFAACPSGINAYLFAARMRTGEAAAAAAVSLSTGLAVVTVTLWLLVLGVGGGMP